MSDNQRAIDAQAARWASIAAKAQGKGPAAIKAAGKVTSPSPPPSAGVKSDIKWGEQATEDTQYSKKNPPFIYPTPAERIATLNDSNTDSTKLGIKRGYIRRLTEYYNHVKGSPTLDTLRCNFQFNPQTISRSVQANYDMQFFFNQSPDQLAQPIPGQSTFSIELLFNREAEVATNMYRGEDGKLLKGNSYETSNIATNPAAYITEQYDPKWVTEIGVLADLKILDDIIGQGIAQDLIENASAFKTTSTGNKTTGKDETDTSSTDAASGFNSAKLGPFASNMGNKAFLVPTPIRLLISELFMIEGFVMSSQVVFNKFTPNMVPTQALVGLQIQALYFGFAQKNTFLSTLDVSPDPGNGSPVVTGTQTAADKAIVAQTQQGMENFFRTVYWQEGKNGTRSLIDSIFNNAKNDQIFNFTSEVSQKGHDFYQAATAKGKTGGGLSITFSGRIKIWWHSYVDGASNSRSTIPTSAGGSWTYKTGAPPSAATGGISLSSWGTSSSPFTLSCQDFHTKYDVSNTFSDTCYFGLGSDDDYEAHYKWERPIANLPIPFNQDKFNVDLEINIKVTRGGQTLYAPQKIIKSYRGLEAGDERLWESVSLSPAYLERKRIN